MTTPKSTCRRMDSSDNLDDVDTDEELQIAFSEGKLQDLKSGLIKPLVAKKDCTNDILGINAKINELKTNNADWLERMDVVIATDNDTEECVSHSDDFKREMHFLHAAQSSVIVGINKLSELGISAARPGDYFAEMLKTDTHMRRVRQNLLNKQKRIEATEKAKKLREIRKYGKKVQIEILEQRIKDKKTTVQAVKNYSKGKGDKPSFLTREDDLPTVEKEYGNKRNKGQRDNMKGGKSKRREMKDTRYGTGGRKKFLKKNTADSSADMTSFKKKWSTTNKKSDKGGSKRLGKSRRHNQKVKRGKGKKR